MCVSASALLKVFRRPLSTSKNRLKYIRVLGIESSCDDTGVGAVDSEKKILGEALYSQSEIHTLHGGIVPSIAENIHRKCLPILVDEVLQKTNLGVKDFDAIAVTNAPGLKTCLEAGVEFAKHLCLLHSVPLIPVHHMEAHALTITLLENVKFPFLSLLISGGHCILVFVESPKKFLVLGEGGKLSPGCLLDKIARRLKLKNLPGYTTMQGGPLIEKLAETGNPLAFTLSIRNLLDRSCQFYYSGLLSQTQALIDRTEEDLGIKGSEVLPNVADICASLQFAICGMLCDRLEIAMRYLKQKNLMADTEKVLVMSGGVASNEFIRKMVKHVCCAYDYELMVPPKKYCTDNGVMIAWDAVEKLKENVATVPPSDLDQVKVIPRMKFGEKALDVAAVANKGHFISLQKLL